MPRPTAAACRRLQLLNAYVYEYRKGVRQLMLYTGWRDDLPLARAKLENFGIDYFVQEVGPTKVNLYFGRRAHVDTVRHIVTKPLTQLSPEEDFILGTLLGYDGEQQCLRFLGRVHQEAPRGAVAA